MNWIRTEERLPEKGESVIGWYIHEDGEYPLAVYRDKLGDWSQEPDGEEITVPDMWTLITAPQKD